MPKKPPRKRRQYRARGESTEHLAALNRKLSQLSDELRDMNAAMAELNRLQERKALELAETQAAIDAAASGSYAEPELPEDLPPVEPS